MTPPAFDESQLKDDFTPTVNTFIEPHSNTSTAPPVPAPTPVAKASIYIPPPPTPTCAACPMQPDFAETTGMAFALGAIVGAVLVLAFSKQSAVASDA